MKHNVLKIDCWIVAVSLLVMMRMGARAADSPQPAKKISLATNEVSMDDLVAEITSNNPELGFYRSEIAAAKGERRTAGTFPNPDLSGTLGGKRVNGSSLAGTLCSRLMKRRAPGNVPAR